MTLERTARHAGYKVRNVTRLVRRNIDPQKHIVASLLMPVSRPVLISKTPTSVSRAMTGASALTPRAMFSGTVSCRHTNVVH